MESDGVRIRQLSSIQTVRTTKEAVSGVWNQALPDAVNTTTYFH